MLTLQTVCPYGLNDREGDEYIAEKDSRVVGNIDVYTNVQSIITLKLNFITKFC